MQLLNNHVGTYSVLYVYSPYSPNTYWFISGFSLNGEEQTTI